ncbi:hypothetical protein CP533_2902 [Ophiocordyceps camponoti-saundersi (nom. inval.)]|nr:hypothetical protein CP533_2902 [Ophiocordyceps camponoti-saundersi (nom. inval.)]
MTVALLVSRPGNMPGYNSTVDLEEVQSLSRYCFSYFNLRESTPLLVSSSHVVFHQLSSERFVLLFSSFTIVRFVLALLGYLHCCPSRMVIIMLFIGGEYYPSKNSAERPAGPMSISTRITRAEEYGGTYLGIMTQE